MAAFSESAIESEAVLEQVYDAALCRSARRYVAMGPGARLRVCAIDPWRELATIEPDARAINVAALDRDGARVAFAAWRRSPTVEIWATSQGTTQLAELPAPGSEVVALEFCGDGSLLAVVSAEGHVRLWDTTSWKLVEHAQAPTHVRMAIAIADDGAWLAVAGQDDRGARIDAWRRSSRQFTPIASGLLGQVLDLDHVGARLGVSMDVRWTPDAPAAYLWSEIEGLRPLQTPARQPSARLGPHIDSVALDPNGRTLVLAGGLACSGWGTHAWSSTDAGPLRELDLRNGELGPSPARLRDVAVRDDGNIVAVGDGVTIWNRDGSIVARMNHQGQAMGPDGILLCS